MIGCYIIFCQGSMQSPAFVTHRSKSIFWVMKLSLFNNFVCLPHSSPKCVHVCFSFYFSSLPWNSLLVLLTFQDRQFYITYEFKIICEIPPHFLINESKVRMTWMGDTPHFTLKTQFPITFTRPCVLFL